LGHVLGALWGRVDFVVADFIRPIFALPVPFSFLDTCTNLPFHASLGFGELARKAGTFVQSRLHLHEIEFGDIGVAQQFVEFSFHFLNACKDALAFALDEGVSSSGHPL